MINYPLMQIFQPQNLLVPLQYCYPKIKVYTNDVISVYALVGCDQSQFGATSGQFSGSGKFVILAHEYV